MPVFWRAGAASFCAAAKLRPAALAARKPFRVPLLTSALGDVAKADPVEQLGAGEPVEGPEACLCSLLGEVHG